MLQWCVRDELESIFSFNGNINYLLVLGVHDSCHLTREQLVPPTPRNSISVQIAMLQITCLSATAFYQMSKLDVRLCIVSFGTT